MQRGVNDLRAEFGTKPVTVGEWILLNWLKPLTITLTFMLQVTVSEYNPPLNSQDLSLKTS